MSWAVRAAELAQAEALAAIHETAFPPDERWGPDAIALQLALPGVFGLMEPRGGMILARTAADEAEVLTLAVRPELRGQGLGRALLDAAIAEARSSGAACMVLEVAVGNKPARRLYERAGFTQVGRRRRYYASGEDALVLRVSLVRSAPPPARDSDADIPLRPG
jgi:ribosomal-protein-alanine N-acetyltransferase